jgi:ribosomal protein L11 methyltransferase
MPWLKAEIEVPNACLGPLEGLLYSQGALSITLTDLADVPVLEPAVGETLLWPDLMVTALFEASTPRDKLAAVLSLAPGVDAASLRFSEVPDREWERERLEKLKPMHFGKSLWVAPGDTVVEAQGAVVVRLDPGLAFGTGSHPTTRLCLEWLAGEPVAGRRVIDYGCGSGILGVAAACLGALEVLCVDHDPQALAATRDNGERNGVADRLVVRNVQARIDGQADLLLANILAATLVQLAPVLAAATRPGGRAALSGILPGQAEEVADAYRPWFGTMQARERSGWVLLSGARTETMG